MRKILLLVLVILFARNICQSQDTLTAQLSSLLKQLKNGEITAENYNKAGVLYYQRYMEYSEEGFVSEILDSAIYYLNKSINLNPRYANAYLNLGVAFAPKSIADPVHTKYELAIKNLNKSLELNIDNKFDAYFLLGLTYFTRYQFQLDKDKSAYLSNDFNKAINSYKKAIEFNSKNWKPYDNLGHHYYQKYAFDYSMETLDSSIYFYEKSVSLNKRNYWSFYQLGMLYDKKGDTGKAIKNYELSVLINNGTDAFYYLIFAYKFQKQYERAIELYEKLLPIIPNPQFVNIYLVLAEICELKGDKVRAVKYENIADNLKKEK